MKKNYKDTYRNLALISQIGLSVITPILMGVFLGQFIDEKLSKNGIFSILFLILGAGAGFMNLFKITKTKGK